MANQDIRITPTDHTDSAALWLDAAAAVLCQLGSSMEVSAADSDTHAAAIAQVQNFLEQAEAELARDTHALTVWPPIVASIARSRETLELYRLALVGACSRSAPRMAHAALHGLCLVVQQARTTIEDAVGEAA